MSGRGGVVGVDMDGVTQRHANLAPAGVANLLQPRAGHFTVRVITLNYGGIQNACNMVLNYQMVPNV